jgi:integrase
MAVRVPPQRRHPDDETRLCERACRTRCSATADRADRARRGTAHEADLRRLLGAVAQSPASVSRVRNLVGLRDCGRKRLLPAFGERPLGELSLDAIRGFVAELADEVEAGELAAKTLNNALGTLVVCLNSAVEDGVLAVNPALRVQRLPPGHIERDYLRLDEIPRYLDACSDVYRPLAELLVGSGLRISEALALRIGDLELEETGGAIVVYRSRKGSAVGSTKSDRFRSVEIGPGLSPVLQDQVARRRGRGRRPVRRPLCSPCRFELPSERWAGGRARVSADRSTGPRSRATGTRMRSRTPRCAICRCTRSATRPPLRGSRPETHMYVPAGSRGHWDDRALLRSSRTTRARRRGNRDGGRDCARGARPAPEERLLTADWDDRAARGSGRILGMILRRVSRAVVSAGQPTPASLRQPPLDVLGDEPKRAILAAEPERRDPAGAGRLVDPGARDGEQASDVIRPQQRRERPSAVLRFGHASSARVRMVPGCCTTVVALLRRMISTVYVR